LSRFASIKSSRPVHTPAVVVDADIPAPSKAASRQGKKAISGYFSPEMSRALHIVALEQGSSLQAVMGEAFDDLMRKYGKHPFGER
jgi:hypothetical protein